MVLTPFSIGHYQRFLAEASLVVPWRDIERWLNATRRETREKSTRRTVKSDPALYKRFSPDFLKVCPVDRTLLYRFGPPPRFRPLESAFSKLISYSSSNVSISLPRLPILDLRRASFTTPFREELVIGSLMLMLLIPL